MLWQLAYAEVYFLNKLWPEFKHSDLKKILNDLKRLKEILGEFKGSIKCQKT